jgi:NDP-sugar pyrophosphorylase family protein
LATATVDTRRTEGAVAPALPGVLAPPRVHLEALTRAVPSRICEGRSIQGVVLAGSFPWDDSPLDRLMPRPLLPVAHRPLISYSLRWLRAHGVRDVVVCLNHASRAARGPIADSGTDLSGLDFYEDLQPRGPAGCARDAALGTTGEVFLVAEGTAIPFVSLADLLETHRASGALATVVVQQEQAGEGNTCLARPSGMYVFERRALELVPQKGFQDIKENLIPRLYRAGEHVGAHVVHARSARVLSAGTYLDANHWAVSRLIARADALEDYEVSGETVVHRSAQVDPQARLAGPVLIGSESRVAAGATLVGPVVLGSGCSVANEAIVSRTVAWNRCLVGAQAVVDECVLADDASVEAGARVDEEILLPARRGEDLGRALRARARSVGSFVTWPRRVVR